MDQRTGDSGPTAITAVGDQFLVATANVFLETSLVLYDSNFTRYIILQREHPTPDARCHFLFVPISYTSNM